MSQVEEWVERMVSAHRRKTQQRPDIQPILQLITLLLPSCSILCILLYRCLTVLPMSLCVHQLFLRSDNRFDSRCATTWHKFIPANSIRNFK